DKPGFRFAPSRLHACNDGGGLVETNRHYQENVMDFKLIGCILLIVGTSIGAGMLALPIATAELGFIGSVILLCTCWFIMTAGALLILEANLWLPQSSNLVSMAKATIGPLGQLVTWISFLLLLYSLLCAYISGGSDLFYNLLASAHLDVPRWLTTVGFTVVFGAIVYQGIRAVDYANRGLMLVKMGAYVLLVILLLPLIDMTKLMQGNLLHLNSAVALMVTITSFGYAAIIPSLRVYFAGDVKKLKTAILVGSLIPLVCYIAWDAAIMGIIPLQGEHGLIAILQSSGATGELVNSLSMAANSPIVVLFIKLFTSVCMVTSFLGVGICLADFLADGLQREKVGLDSVIIHVLTFVPALAIVLFSPNIFVQALEYAGIYCVILLIFLPALMVWCGRYRRHIANGYQVFGGKVLLVLLMLFSVGAIAHRFIG
ncbi:MAG: aromatic amino acid transport family protein, partial [Gammaproteobacteria bacterium]